MSKLPETIMREEINEEFVKVAYPYSMEDENTIEFGVLGQTPERTYEDRNVMFTIKTDIVDTTGVHRKSIDAQMWLNAEDAITLGNRLIAHGNYAMKANMYQHQLIHQKNSLERYVAEGVVDGIIFTLVDRDPLNYGGGFYEFNIKPLFKSGSIPKYDSDFNFNEVIYFSMFSDDFDKQIDQYTGGKVGFSFVGYNRDAEVDKFKKQLDQWD